MRDLIVLDRKLLHMGMWWALQRARDESDMEWVKERDIEMEKLQTDYTWTECLTNQSEQMMMTGFSFFWVNYPFYDQKSYALMVYVENSFTLTILECTAQG